MANRPAAGLVLREGDEARLTRLAPVTTVRSGLAVRARIVLLAADGHVEHGDRGPGRGVAADGDWVARAVPGQGDRGPGRWPRSGRPRTIDHRRIVSATLTPPQKQLGVTHWSSRLLGRHLGVSDATVAKAWRDYGVQPWRSESFRFSTDPELVAKVVDVVGLYMNPPEHAVVLCLDEKSPDPGLGPSRADPAATAKACRRNAPTTTSATAPRPCSRRWTSRPARSPGRASPATATGVPRASSSRSPAPTPTRELHLVMDNYAAHKHPAVKAWLAENPRSTCTSPRPTRPG